MKWLPGLAVICLTVLSSVVCENAIRCYACEDCTKEDASIVQCSARNGIDLSALSYTPTYPVLTQSTPAWGGNPWDPILTPPPYPPQNGGGGNQLYPWDPLLTPPPLVGGNNGDAWYPGNPILTPPPLGGGGNQINPWDPLLTPPPLVGGNNGNYYPGYPILTPPPYYPYYPYGKAKGFKQSQKRYVCVTIRNHGKDASKDIVHRRGCAEIEGYAVGVCDREQVPAVDGGASSCRVCGHSLCNE